MKSKALIIGLSMSFNAFAIGVAGGGAHGFSAAHSSVSAAHPAIHMSAPEPVHVAPSAHADSVHTAPNANVNIGRPTATVAPAPRTPVRTVTQPSTVFPTWVPFFGHTTRQVPCDPKQEKDCD